MGISIIQAEPRSGFLGSSKLDVRWPAYEEAGRDLPRRVSRVEISIGVRKRQKISQDPSRALSTAAENLFRSFVLGRPLVIISTRRASSTCQPAARRMYPRNQSTPERTEPVVKKRTIFCHEVFISAPRLLARARASNAACLSARLV